jgi:hypothetical protein
LTNAVYYFAMKRGIKVAVCLVGGVVSTVGLSLNAGGAVGDNPYHAIVERNVFDLKPPPPPPSAPTVTNTPPPNVKLTGITSMLGTKRAFFMVAPAAQPGKPPGKEESFIIEEGQRQGVIEVLEINQRAATVRIKNDGNESTLALDTSPKLPSGPGGGGGAPGAPGNPAAPRLPGSLVAPPNNGYNPRSAGGGRSPVPVPNQSQYSQYGGNSDLSTLPSRTMRTGNAIDPLQMLQQQPQQQQPQQQDSLVNSQANLSTEEKYVLMEVERQQTQKQVEAGLLPELPPTPLTPQLNQGNNGNASEPNLPPGRGR